MSRFSFPTLFQNLSQVKLTFRACSEWVERMEINFQSNWTGGSIGPVEFLRILSAGLSDTKSLNRLSPEFMPIIDLVPQETVNRVAAWLLQLADQYKTQLQFKMVPAPFMPPAPSSRSWKASDASVEEVMRILERIHIALSFEYHDWGEDGTPELTAPELVKCCAYVVDYVRDRTRSPDAVEWLRHISGKMHDAHKLWGEETMAGDFAPDGDGMPDVSIPGL
jgi:hypothetical protein